MDIDIYNMYNIPGATADKAALQRHVAYTHTHTHIPMYIYIHIYI